ncbi:hypothetical protein TIFTF001_028026 [Ficus carica]|uniref:Uncharacterized protein n=1 Tax=Ficus carica TaxID=3494 RepID=A0AA88DP48_FICCA|nr:hypothetical protein TIFTF001_028026 [Ficus carica]
MGVRRKAIGASSMVREGGVSGLGAISSRVSNFSYYKEGNQVEDKSASKGVHLNTQTLWFIVPDFCAAVVKVLNV